MFFCTHRFLFNPTQINSIYLSVSVSLFLFCFFIILRIILCTLNHFLHHSKPFKEGERDVICRWFTIHQFLCNRREKKKTKQIEMKWILCKDWFTWYWVIYLFCNPSNQLHRWFSVIFFLDKKKLITINAVQYLLIFWNAVVFSLRMQFVNLMPFSN